MREIVIIANQGGNSVSLYPRQGRVRESSKAHSDGLITVFLRIVLIIGKIFIS